MFTRSFFILSLTFHACLSGSEVNRCELIERRLLDAPQPSVVIQELEHAGLLKTMMPELAALVGVPQHKPWHPEGDAYLHTLQVLDAAARRTYETERDKLIFLYTALCHDLGKAITTALDEKGIWRAHKHEEIVVPLARTMLERLGVEESIIVVVCKLSRHHMDPTQFIRHKEPDETYHWLSKELDGVVTLQRLMAFTLCDLQGRGADGPLTKEDFPELEAFKVRAREVGILNTEG